MTGVLKKSRKQISCMLAITMLFLGIYFQGMELTSTFADTSVTSSVHGICLPTAQILSGEACITEMLGICDSFIIDQLANRNICNRREKQLSLEPLCADACIKICSVFSITAILLPDFKRYSRAVIINYIHNQDGKKRI